MNLNPNVSRRMVGFVLAVAAVGFVLVVASQRDAGFNDHPVTLEDRRARAARIAREEFEQAITNTVGYRRTIASSVFIYATEPVTNWWGQARVEFINRRGGVEAIERKFLFSQHGNSVACVPVNDEQFYAFLKEKK